MGQQPVEEYLLSLPERALRSAAALTGGITFFLTQTLLPDFVKDSTTYRVTLGDLQRFLITRIAQVETSDAAPVLPLSDDYLTHKMAGNVIEAASLLAVRFSPVWAFAIVADVAGGSSYYFNRLVAQLKEDQIIDQDTSLANIQDLLGTIQQTSNTSAEAIDRPPLNQRELNQIVDKLRDDYSQLTRSGLNLMPRVNDLQEQMEQVSESEGISTEELGDILTLEATRVSKTGADAVLAVGKTTGEVFEERILNSYSKTLDKIAEFGLPKYVGNSLAPFLNSAINHWDPGRSTWTQRKLAQFRDDG